MEILIVVIIIITAGSNLFLSDRQSKKLEQVHRLVNSNMTAAMQAELDARIQQVILMRQVIILNRANKLEPTKDALDAITYTEAKIADLEARLGDRGAV